MINPLGVLWAYTPEAGLAMAQYLFPRNIFDFDVTVI